MNTDLDNDLATAVADFLGHKRALGRKYQTEQATLQDLRYQLTFTETARQCSIVGRTMRMRVGVQFRNILTGDQKKLIVE